MSISDPDVDDEIRFMLSVVKGRPVTQSEVDYTKSMMIKSGRYARMKPIVRALKMIRAQSMNDFDRSHP